MPETMNWKELQESIKRCTKCRAAGLSGVKCPDVRVPTVEPKNVKLLFISEAPPLNTLFYFYNENSKDRLRNRLFGILRDMGYEISTIKDFVDAGFFLLPTVKCPSARDGCNTAPSGRVIKLCAAQHLKREIACIRPDGICLLGRTALQGLSCLRDLGAVQVHDSVGLRGTVSEVAGSVLEVEISGKHNVALIPSYWPTQRHRKYHEIGEHIKLLMDAIGF
ncbi:MAG: uracil-DNA glycosylase family protein [Methanomicrobia archaeon]|nr:uracil-DNA glycosylase family protein [Methanomicrobia archaeon]